MAFRCHQDSVTFSNFLSLTNLVLVPLYSALGKPPLDAAIHGSKAEELDMLRASLKAKSQQVDELAREMKLYPTEADSSIKFMLGTEAQRRARLEVEHTAQQGDGVARASKLAI